jgi:WhiB family transcriptional regulator, redox-sensing transcriptional regulator
MEADEEAWRERAGCRSQNPDLLFTEGAAQNEAKRVCTPCPVRTECLAHALDHRIEHGIWGGMTERERRALLRRRSTVTSWKDLLDAARAEHAKQLPLPESGTEPEGRRRRPIPPVSRHMKQPRAFDLVLNGKPAGSSGPVPHEAAPKGTAGVRAYPTSAA